MRCRRAEFARQIAGKTSVAMMYERWNDFFSQAGVASVVYAPLREALRAPLPRPLEVARGTGARRCLFAAR